MEYLFPWTSRTLHFAVLITYLLVLFDIYTIYESYFPAMVWIFVSFPQAPKSYVEIQTPKVMVLEGDLGGDQLKRPEPSCLGSVCLWKRPQRARSYLPPLEGTAGKHFYTPESRLSPDTKSAVTLILDFSVSRTGEINVSYLSAIQFMAFLL